MSRLLTRLFLTIYLAAAAAALMICSVLINSGSSPYVSLWFRDDTAWLVGTLAAAVKILCLALTAVHGWRAVRRFFTAPGAAVMPAFAGILTLAASVVVPAVLLECERGSSFDAVSYSSPAAAAMAPHAVQHSY